MAGVFLRGGGGASACFRALCTQQKSVLLSLLSDPSESGWVITESPHCCIVSTCLFICIYFALWPVGLQESAQMRLLTLVARSCWPRHFFCVLNVSLQTDKLQPKHSGHFHTITSSSSACLGSSGARACFRPGRCSSRPPGTSWRRWTTGACSSRCPAWMTPSRCCRWLWSANVSGFGRSPNTFPVILSSMTY